MDRFYTVQETRALKDLLRTIDDLQSRIDAQKAFHKDLWAAIQEKLHVDWTYNPNAIEGSSLTRGETLFFCRKG